MFFSRNLFFFLISHQIWKDSDHISDLFSNLKEYDRCDCFLSDHEPIKRKSVWFIIKRNDTFKRVIGITVKDPLELMV